MPDKTTQNSSDPAASANRQQQHERLSHISNSAEKEAKTDPVGALKRLKEALAKFF
jgi:hypothetical protein